MSLSKEEVLSIYTEGKSEFQTAMEMMKAEPNQELTNREFYELHKADFREDGKLNSFVFVVANDWERCIKDEAESYVKIVAYFKEVVASLQSELAEVSE